MPKVFNDGRKYGDKDDCQDDQGEIIFHNWNVSEKVSAENAYRWPGNSTDDIVADEFQICHPTSACNKRRKSADNGHEPGNDDSLASVPFKKGMCPVKILLFKNARVFFKSLGAQEMTNGIIHSISKNRG